MAKEDVQWGFCINITFGQIFVFPKFQCVETYLYFYELSDEKKFRLTHLISTKFEHENDGYLLVTSGKCLSYLSWFLHNSRRANISADDRIHSGCKKDHPGNISDKTGFIKMTTMSVSCSWVR